MPMALDMNAVKSYLEHSKELPVTVRNSVMNIISAPNILQSESATKDLMDGFTKSDSPLKNIFAPEFMTIPPPLHVSTG